MLIQGFSDRNRVNILLTNYYKLICSGVNPEQILVILLNSYKKANFINEIKKINPEINLEKHKIYTFWGLCYNAFNDNWDYISKISGINQVETKPNLCGLEVSQYIFKQSIKTADFSDYISKVNLLHQLFRRYSLIVQNALDFEDIKKRSELLNEVFYIDAQKAIDDYKMKTIQYKSFDYLRQLAVLPLIYKNTEYFDGIKYLFIDDADEFSYAFWQFIDSIMPHIQDYYIAYDKDGFSRCGYLGAYKNAINDFKNKYSPVEKNLTSNENQNINLFCNAIKNNQKALLTDIVHNGSIKRLDMIESVLSHINKLIRQGVRPNNIAVITPITDEILIKNIITSNFNIDFQVISGNEKLNNNNIVKHIIIILKLVNNLPVMDYELKSLLIKLLKIPYRKCMEIINYYFLNKEFIKCKFDEDNYDYAYTKLYSLINTLKKTQNSLSEQIKSIYTNLLKDFDDNKDVEKYDFLLKEAGNFEIAFEGTIKNVTEEFIVQIQNSVISENPADSFSLIKDNVIVSTPQKIIDFSINTKYQLWLDISNEEWMKQDTGTLYNAWVLNRDWDKNTYTLEDNINLTRDKTSRIIRKLMFLTHNITLFSSIYDNNGNENFGGIIDFLALKESKIKKLNIIPREDQKPVLDYHKGKMGVMAVPGAGKTTILLLLILKLIENGTKPENIFVLTYMESAAKNFKEKLQSAIPDSCELPNISTIHGLALRIIKENANYTKVGLDDKFEIADDTTKEKIIKELFYKSKIDDEKYDNYLKCISIVKLSGCVEELYSKYKDIQDFYNFYESYNKVLKQNNLIDYDDMLYYAVKILENNSEILEYYQNTCKYIIEDEAQDSTDIQQKLISLLNGKYNNLVRCGDINQAITSTFTNSNPESFKKYINTNKKVEMISSQRCSEPVYKLANELVEQASSDDELKNAFYKIKMKGTDKNPESKIIPKYFSFDDDKQEKEFILNRVNEIYKNNPKSTIAILLRLNSQVNEYNELFLSNGVKTSIRSDCLAQKKIYKIIVAVLNVINNPQNNKFTEELAKMYGLGNNSIEYIKNLDKPFISQNPDNINDEGLLQLYWDIDYWLNNSDENADILTLNIGLYYAKNTSDKSNSYMISTMMRRLIGENDNLESIVNKLDYAAQKPVSAYKFFEDENNVNVDKNPVFIMTMHKAKGDEFDFVFIPELNEENYSTTIKNVKIKNGNHFIQTIKNSVEKCGIKQVDEIKSEQVYETLRLLYVGITRAKQVLVFSNALNYKKRRNTKKVQIIQKIINLPIETK
ncbi:UvrD-helicase domain-containing protein [bacterium]|nr:UvrD-helicase domain-containing protein [bacterium]